MGAGWKNAGRAENANKKGAVVNKLAREIQVAAKMGVPDPEHNARLRAAVDAARKASVSRDTIERAIRKGAGLDSDAAAIETVIYEGFTPHKVPVIVECLTDNKNRTASNIKAIFRKGQIGSIGSVTWMFDHLGLIEANHKDKNLDIESVAIEAGAQNVELLDKKDIGEGQIGARFFTERSDLDTVGKFLTQAGWNVTTSEMTYHPKNYVELSGDQKKEVVAFLDELNDDDDTSRVYVAIK